MSRDRHVVILDPAEDGPESYESRLRYLADWIDAQPGWSAERVNLSYLEVVVQRQEVSVVLDAYGAGQDRVWRKLVDDALALSRAPVRWVSAHYNGQGYVFPAFAHLSMPAAYETILLILQAVADGEEVVGTFDTRSVSDALRISVVEASDELLAYLARHPQVLRELPWRGFERVVASLLEKSGFTVQLQRGVKDGGVDIVAARHDHFGEIVLAVQCKQTTRKVGVGVVRELYGVASQRQSSIATLATTSFFTADAIEFQRRVSARLSLRDFDAMSKWLSSATQPK